MTAPADKPLLWRQIVRPCLLTRADILTLRGKQLACWCPLDQPCHADVLAEMAANME